MADISVIDRLKNEISSIESGNKKPTCQERARKSGEPKDAFKKIVGLVNASDRSEKTLRERLVREGFPDREIDDAIERAKRFGIIDDSRYADVLIRSRLRQGRGSSGIERELREQGISVESIDGWPFEYGIDDESEYQRALRFIESHPSRSKSRREGAYRKLLQKGYASSVAAAAARAWSERS